VKQSLFGLDTKHFVTKSDHDKEKDGEIFLFVKPMRDKPLSKEDVDKKSDVVHIVLTGWKGQYNIKHPRYQKVLYSSHSSPAELETFVKGLNPGKLIFNLNGAEKSNDKKRLSF